MLPVPESAQRAAPVGLARKLRRGVARNLGLIRDRHPSRDLDGEVAELNGHLQHQLGLGENVPSNQTLRQAPAAGAPADDRRRGEREAEDAANAKLPPSERRAAEAAPPAVAGAAAAGAHGGDEGGERCAPGVLELASGGFAQTVLLCNGLSSKSTS